MRRARLVSSELELGNVSPHGSPSLSSPRLRSGTQSKSDRRLLTRPPRRLPRPRTVLISCGGLILVVLVISWLLQPVLILAYFKLRNHAVDNRWYGNACRVRKRPLAFVIQQDTAAVVWETSCELKGLELDWQLQSEDSQYDGWRTVPSEGKWMPGDVTETHYVHRALLSPIETDGQISVRMRDGERVITSTSLPWRLRSSSVSIAAVSDNQFNVRVFQQIMRRIGRSRPQPQLLLHAGDAVQTAGSLQQWQTDFWDPISLLGSSKSMPPILYSVGNHDYDVTSLYAYTIGRGPSWRALTIGRTRWVVLDGQTDGGEDDAQDRWLREEVTSEAWTTASIRVIVVHHAPFVEFWEPTAWHDGESKWAPHVRHRFAPIWHDAGASLVISGHQHAYSRGFLSHTHALAYTTVSSSDQLDLIALPAPDAHNGTVYAIIGGAGGSLDTDRVESWDFFEKSVTGEHHWISLSVETGVLPTIDATTRVYDEGRRCEMVDRVRWRTLSRSGTTLDKVAIERCVT